MLSLGYLYFDIEYFENFSKIIFFFIDTCINPMKFWTLFKHLRP